MAKETKRGRGRPVAHPLTTNQVKAVIARLKKGLSPAKIAEDLGIHEYAALRVKRSGVV